ncbi:MAG: hypothetical protein ACRDVD_01080 [Acidimicrobiia bacterium]
MAMAPEETAPNKSDQGRSRPNLAADIDRMIDEWGDQSFPASDPPGGLPPSLRAALVHRPDQALSPAITRQALD